MNDDLSIERFMSMIAERGLSMRRYMVPRHSNALGRYEDDLVDVMSDGDILATYNTVVVQFF